MNETSPEFKALFNDTFKGMPVNQLKNVCKIMITGSDSYSELADNLYKCLKATLVNVERKK